MTTVQVGDICPEQLFPDNAGDEAAASLKPAIKFEKRHPISGTI